MSTPTTIFIDTSIFDQSAYDLNAASFRAFRLLAKPIRLKLLIPDPIAREIHRHISERSHAALKSIAEEFANLSFLIEANWEGEAEDIEVTDFDELEYYVVGIGDYSYILSFTSEISFSAYVSYWDLETAIYDEGDVIPWNQIEGRVETTVSVSGTVKIMTDENERSILECHNTEFDQDYIEIDREPDEFQSNC